MRTQGGFAVAMAYEKAPDPFKMDGIAAEFFDAAMIDLRGILLPAVRFFEDADAVDDAGCIFVAVAHKTNDLAQERDRRISERKNEVSTFIFSFFSATQFLPLAIL